MRCFASVISKTRLNLFSDLVNSMNTASWHASGLFQGLSLKSSSRFKAEEAGRCWDHSCSSGLDSRLNVARLILPLERTHVDQARGRAGTLQTHCKVLLERHLCIEPIMNHITTSYWYNLVIETVSRGKGASVRRLGQRSGPDWSFCTFWMDVSLA